MCRKIHALSAFASERQKIIINDRDPSTRTCRGTITSKTRQKGIISWQLIRKEKKRKEKKRKEKKRKEEKRRMRTIPKLNYFLIVLSCVGNWLALAYRPLSSLFNNKKLVRKNALSRVFSGMLSGAMKKIASRELSLNMVSVSPLGNLYFPCSCS